MSEQNNLKIILVHGGGHGAWCWYKVVAMLRSQGYSVTAIDLAACGSDPRRMPEDVSTFDEYAQPLMDLLASMAEGEKVVLVGHSFGGLSLAKAMDAFPEKIAVAVFVTAVMPDTIHSPFYIFDKIGNSLQVGPILPTMPASETKLDGSLCHFEQSPEMYAKIEMKSIVIPGKAEPFIILALQPTHLASYLYQNCSFEDLTLAEIMVRPASIFREDLNSKMSFSEERYGSVDKVFIVCGEDAVFTADFQNWMIQNSTVKEVMEIKEADHMAMLSKPKELCQCLKKIVSNYAK